MQMVVLGEGIDWMNTIDTSDSSKNGKNWYDYLYAAMAGRA